MKRLSVLIQNPKHPETEFHGYALAEELGGQTIAFFSTQKFLPEVELDLSFIVQGELQTYKTTMSHLHEQISSGRIMNAVPTEANPFPAQKFYRCFAKIVSEVKHAGTTEGEIATVTELHGADNVIIGGAEPTPTEELPEVKAA